MFCFIRTFRCKVVNVRYFSSVIDTDVIIVGAGPTGLTASCLLSQYGVRSVVIEKNSNVTQHPQAHYINNRTMEIFRSISGNLSEEVTRLTPPLNEWRKFIYCDKMIHKNQMIFGEVDHFENLNSPFIPNNVSPEPVAHLSQRKLIPLILQRAKNLGGEIQFNQEVIKISDSSQQVKVFYKDQKMQNNNNNQKKDDLKQINGKYLIAADGANSKIRDQLGIKMQGERALQNLLNVHFISKGMGKMAMSNPAMLYFVFNSDVVLVFVGHDLKSGEFVAQIPYWPPYQQPSDFPTKKMVQLIRQAAGDTNMDVDVKEVRGWTMSAQVAERFQAGNIFLAGDAAHRFPPAGGFGQNTGIQDAHNLAWKLSLVLKGAADQRLLHTYETERHKIAKQNTDLSVKNWKEAVSISTAIGLDPRLANMLNRVVDASPLPKAVNKFVLETSMIAGRRFAGVWGPLANMRKRALDQIFKTGVSLRLQFPREDLGFSYCGNEGGSIGRGTEFVPQVLSGLRMPHWNLKIIKGPIQGSVDEERNKHKSTQNIQISSLDLLPFSQAYFLVLIPLQQTNSKKLSQIQKQLPVRICFVADNTFEKKNLHQSLQDSNFSCVQDVDNNACINQIGRGGIVVRPDGHVCHILKHWGERDPENLLEKEIVETVLYKLKKNKNSIQWEDIGKSFF